MYQGIGQSDSEDGRIDWFIKVLVSQRMEELIVVSRYWSVRLGGWKNLLVYQGIGQSEDGRIDWCIKLLVSQTQRMEELIGVSRYWSVRGWKN